MELASHEGPVTEWPVANFQFQPAGSCIRKLNAAATVFSFPPLMINLPPSHFFPSSHFQGAGQRIRLSLLLMAPFKVPILTLASHKSRKGPSTDSQIAALERKGSDDKACREIETAHPGYLGSQDTFYVGNLKSVGRIYQQTFVDTYSKMVHCKLYLTQTLITAADLLNDRVLPFYASNGLPMLRILVDRGTEFCGKVDQHDCQLYLAINDIEHTKSKVMPPQTDSICERFHKTIQNEFCQVMFPKSYMAVLMHYNRILMNGWLTITMTESIRGKCVAAVSNGNVT